MFTRAHIYTLTGACVLRRLWNSVEKIEKSKNSQLAREIEISIPKELDREKQIELVKGYVKENFVNVGMCADIALHDKNDGNPHAHILLTMRPFNEDTTWGAKSKRRIYP
ncbi:MobA/MobL family protein [Treponema putidum]|uniref:MobA/MobL family protein n=1 Tax=Treponema putidum TaxID=221027 RepID=UPI003D90717F